MADALEKKKPPAAGQTNVDRIRNMSDEELTEFLFNLLLDEGDAIGFCQCKEWCIENIENIPPENCKQCLLEWLKGSVK